MTSAASTVLADALALPDHERIDPPSVLEDGWRESIEARIARAERGETTPVEWSDVQAKILAKLANR